MYIYIYIYIQRERERSIINIIITIITIIMFVSISIIIITTTSHTCIHIYIYMCVYITSEVEDAQIPRVTRDRYVEVRVTCFVAAAASNSLYATPLLGREIKLCASPSDSRERCGEKSKTCRANDGREELTQQLKQSRLQLTRQIVTNIICHQ